MREQRQAAFDGHLVGKADVIIRGERPRIEDYKTGSIYNANDPEEVKEQYRRQMLLYAVLEHEDTGTWPVTATLIPIEGDPLEIAIDPQEATRAAEEALAGLSAYNTAVESGVEPVAMAAPSQDVCRFCSFAIDCPALWMTVDTSWQEAGYTMLAGTINSTEVAHTGTVNLTVSAIRGSVPPGDYLLYQLDPQRFGSSRGDSRNGDRRQLAHRRS